MTKPKSELRERWGIVLACQLGVGAGVIGLPFYTMGVFVGPLEEQYGWSRAAIQGMFSTFITVGLLMVPLVGALTEKYGVRRVTIPSLVGAAIGFACLGLLTRSLPTFYFGGVCLAILGAGTTPITWTTAISGWFDRQRGLALGIAMAGTGIGALLAPSYVGMLIDAFSWRVAYLGLAIIPLCVIPFVYWQLRDPPGASGSKGTSSRVALQGVSVAEALRDYRFWVIAAAFFVISTSLTGSIPNLVPLLLDGGMTTTKAAATAGLLGLSVIAGRLVTGFLIDRLWAPGVAAVLLSAPAISVLILGEPPLNMELVPLAVMLLGLAAGAEFDLIAFLVSRYFGLRHYPKIYSMLYITMVAGASFSPAMFGYFYDVLGSYQIILRVAAGLFLSGGILLLALGRYPDLYSPEHEH